MSVAPTSALITLTPAAAARISELTGQQPEAVGLMVGVNNKGCSGHSYTMRLITAQEKEQFAALPKFKQPLMVQQHGATVFLENGAEIYLLGSQMDFVQDGLHAKFTFTNPNEKSRCGCGESFGV